MCVLFCFSKSVVTFAKAWQSLVGETTYHDRVHFSPLFLMFGYDITSPTKAPNPPPRSSFLLENLITVSDSHPSFDEADYTLIQERERCFLQQNFSIAQLCVHLFC